MSFDLPANIEREVELYAESESISPAEAAIQLVQAGLQTAQEKGRTTLISDEEVAAFERAFPGLKYMDDVTDEEWDRVLERAKRMSMEGLSGGA